jgi:CRP-like cAMP-binding protein
MNLKELSKKYGQWEAFPKKSMVFNQGDSDKFIYVITKGALKAFYLTPDGKEFIKSFLFAGDYIASLQALNGGVCSFNILCLQDVELVKIPYSSVLHSAKEDIDTANSIIDLLTSFAMKKEQREYELLCLDAEHRYQNLLTRFEGISDVITQNDIARYLGITPVALSRIKNRN